MPTHKCSAIVFHFSLLLALSAGCGENSTSTSPQSKPVETPNVTEPNGATPLEEPAKTTSVGEPVEPQNQPKVTPAVSGTPSETAATPPVVAPVAKNPKPSFKPTAEQLSLWKLADFVPLQMVQYQEHNGIGFVSFVTPVSNGKEYLLGGTRLTLWNLKDSEPIHEFIEAKTEEKERLLSFAVSPDGTWCVAGDASGLLRKFDIPNRKEIGSKETKSPIVRLAISPDGKEMATVSYNSEISIWDADTLSNKKTFKPDSRDIKQLQYVAPNLLVIAGESMSGWDTSSGQKQNTYPAERYQSVVALTPNKTEMVFGGKESLQRWGIQEAKSLGEYRGVPYRDAAIRFSDDGALVAVASNDGVRILDALSGQMRQVIDASGAAITDIAWLPNSQLLLTVNESARSRIWGRPEECRKLGIEPLSTPSIEASSNSSEPATVAQNIALLDLRTLPKPPGAKTGNDSFNVSSYSAEAKPSDVRDFYRYVLGQRGWEELSDNSSDSSLQFTKSGHQLQISMYSPQPSESTVSLSHAGNFDLTKTPMVSQIKETVYAGATAIIYKVEANLLKTETELLKQFHQAGWTNVARLNRSQSDRGDGRDFEFVKGGTVIHVMVQRDPMDPKLLVVNHSQSISLNALPVPPDAGLMEWDDHLECQMVANTTLSLEEATSFYESEMKKHGWTPREKGKRIDKDRVYLSFYSDQREATVALEKGAGFTRIRAGKYSANSWQKPEDSNTPSSEEKVPQESSTPVAKPTNIEAADMPVLHATSTSYDATIGRIRFVLDKTPLAEVAKDYEEAMGKLGWSTESVGGASKDAVNLIFKLGSETIYYQSSIDPLGEAQVVLAGGGLVWDKPIATSQWIPYATWLRNNKLPASLRLLDTYETQMQKLAK